MAKGEYQSCMTSKLRALPKGISKTERKLEFCVVSKLCSGKSSNRADAIDVCSGPKAPKAAKTPRGSRPKRTYYDPDDGPPVIPDGYEICNT